jgi:glycosyltransferase involved in cell wall biosynthesis
LKENYFVNNHGKSVCIVSIYPPKGTSHPEAGGVASYTYNLAMALRQQTDRLTVVCDVMDGKLDRYDENGITVKRAFKKNLLFFWKIAKEVRKSKCDIVHYQQELNLYGGIVSAFLLPIAMMLSGGLSRHRAITFHGVVSLDQVTPAFVKENNSALPAPLVKAALWMLYKLLSFASDAIIVHEEPFKQRLIEQYKVSSSKIHVIPHGVESKDRIERNVALCEIGLEPTAQVVLFLGYLTGYKGIDLLIEGYAEYVTQNPDKKSVLVIGAGKHPKLKDDAKYLHESYERLEQKAAKMIPSHRYRWDGFIPEEKLQAYYSASQLSIYPYTVAMSSSGPMAMSIAYNVPFIGSDVFDEFFDYEGHFFEQNPVAFAEVLGRVLDGTETNDLIAQLREERLWPNVAKKHLLAYEGEVENA